MSWDIFVQHLPPDAKSVADIPTGFRPAFIGKRSMIIERIKEVVPTANFSDPTWGLIDGEGLSIEISIRPDEDCRGFVFHVRGGDAAADAIDSFRKWKAYRDQVANRNIQVN